MKKYLSAIVCAFLLLSSSLCLADQFTNLSSPGTPYSPVYTLGEKYTQGFGFTAISTEDLTAIEIVLGSSTGTGNPTISLYSANSNWEKVNLLESWTVLQSSIIPNGSSSTTSIVTTLDSALHPTLTLDANYWIIGTNESGSSSTWYVNQKQNYQPYYSNGTIILPGAFGSPASGAFAVNSSPSTPPIPTPEPATMLLLGLSLVGLAGLRRKR